MCIILVRFTNTWIKFGAFWIRNIRAQSHTHNGMCVSPKLLVCLHSECHPLFSTLLILLLLPLFAVAQQHPFSVRWCRVRTCMHTSIRTVPLIVYLILCHLWWLLVCAREWKKGRIASLIFHSSVLFSPFVFMLTFLFDFNGDKKNNCETEICAENYAHWSIALVTYRILFCFHYNFGEIIWVIEA